MPDPRAALAAALEAPELRGLEGRFHAHITVLGDPAATERVCAATEARLTVIDLAGDREQRDAMVTLDHHGELSTFGPRLFALLDALADEGMAFVRVKVEHGSTPTLPRYDRHHYREVHIKLRVSPPEFQGVMAGLAEGKEHWGFALSRNPREQTTDHVLQFVNLRIYEGDLDAANARVAALVGWLGGLGLAPVEVRQETAVIDTDHAVDAWWA